jgi:hypothetical protein
MIFKLQLDKNQVTIILDGAANEDDDDQFANFDPVMKVDIDLHITA